MNLSKRAIPPIVKYNGRILLPYRPQPEHTLEQSMEAPYEIHLVEFQSESDSDEFYRTKNEKNMSIQRVNHSNRCG
jgi:hypothetical protein